MGGVKLAAPERNKKKHIGPIDPHALKIPARRAESYSVRFTLIFTLNQNRSKTVEAP
jgi:hypothetical protein